MTDIPFKTISEAARDRAEGLVLSWFPEGRREGDEWVTRNPRRDDRKVGSFSINLKSGIWKDFASDDKGGDLVSLYAFRFTHDDQGAAARELSKELGIDAPAAPRPSRKAVAPRPALPTPSGSPAPPTKHYKLGTHSREWLYRDRTGAELYRVRRFDTPDGKEYRPLSFKDGNWTWEYPPEPRPLYGLDRLANANKSTVLVTEGEKAADAAARMFPAFAVVTSPAGAASAKKADWTPLKGRQVVIWPDNDLKDPKTGKVPGLEYAGAVATQLKALGVTARVVDVPKTWPEKWDLADTPPDGTTPFTFQELIDQAQPWEGTAESESAPTSRPLIDYLLTGPQLAKAHFPPRILLLDPWLTTASISMVYAPTGVGKSWFVMEEARALTLGKPFFQWEVSEPKSVLYVDGELPSDEIQARFLFLYGGQLPDNLTILPSEALWLNDSPLDLSDIEAGQARIDELLTTMEERGQRPDLVILDNLSTLTTGDENDNSAQTGLMRWLMKIRHRQYAVQFVHHTGKSGDQRGASKRKDNLDATISLTDAGTEGAGFKVEFVKWRCKSKPKDSAWALETGRHGEALWVPINPAIPQWQVALVLIAEESPKDVSALGRLMDVTRQGADRHVKVLREKGLLKAVGLDLTPKGTRMVFELRGKVSA